MAKAFGLLILVGVAGAAAVYQWVYLPRERALAEERREAAAILERVADLESQRDRLQGEVTDLRGRVAEKEEQLAEFESTKGELVRELEQEIAKGRVQIERIRDELRVDLVDEILFASGETSLKPEGEAVLRKVGEVLKRVEDRSIEVQGHTDDVAIGGALAARFPTNWELSAARAIHVIRFLQEGVGIDPARLSAKAYAQYRPRASNETPEGRRRNRRIEILMGPGPSTEGATPEE